MGFLGEELHVKIICEDKKQKLYLKVHILKYMWRKFQLKQTTFSFSR